MKIRSFRRHGTTVVIFRNLRLRIERTESNQAEHRPPRRSTTIKNLEKPMEKLPISSHDPIVPAVVASMRTAPRHKAGTAAHHGRHSVTARHISVLLRKYNRAIGTKIASTPLRYETRTRSRDIYHITVIRGLAVN